MHHLLWEALKHIAVHAGVHAARHMAHKDKDTTPCAKCGVTTGRAYKTNCCGVLLCQEHFDVYLQVNKQQGVKCVICGGA